LIATKILFLHQLSNNSLKRKDTANLLDAKIAGTKEKLKKEALVFDDSKMTIPSFERKRERNNELYRR
jgi:hypothetical protein